MGTVSQYKALLSLRERADEDMTDLEQAEFKNLVLHQWSHGDVSSEFDRLNKKLPATPHQMVKVGELELQAYGAPLSAGTLISYFDADKKIKNLLLFMKKRAALAQDASDPLDLEAQAQHLEFMAEALRRRAAMTEAQRHDADTWYLEPETA
ncbi:hypothetical protein ABS642_01050 [Microbacterium sp. A8/3-1]|uniref:Uncharacterized protein n=1 Tax=Microbacterium sp. A8/3-1 TaxID=3160749 RepID=A0AAU7VWG3_9MICO